MFCKNCGKNIGDAKFCQYCGNSNDSTTNVTVNLVQNSLFNIIKDKVKQIGQGKLINLTSIVACVIGIIIRIVNNEIDVVYSALAQDDYFVVSESGRNYMLIVIALQVIISLLLYNDAKKEKIKITGKAVALLLVSLAIQVVAMVLQLPAPY